MGNNLIIVESPAKAKTIEKFLGKEYKVKSSFGHIRDLVKKNFGVDVNNNYEPEYEVLTEKKKVVTELRKEVKNAASILLASDEDREGEAIAWHLWEVLKLKNKDTKRIVFNEITKPAIRKAVANPRDINLDLVKSQQARRILDRLVGFELSSVLWKKVQSKLSAGRVQSVAVRLLVDREREIMNFKPSSSFKVTAIFKAVDINGNINKIEAELSEKFASEKDAVNFINKTGKSDYTVKSIEKKPAKRTPAAPFTTSSLQQEASRKLHFPVSKTMRVAQKLYEAGKITYMRTDSVNLSNIAKKTIKNEIVKEFGEKYYKGRNYKTKVKGAQEAHEAIRPTYIDNKSVSGSSDERRLYELIRNRTLASQMSNAEFERTTIEIDINNNKLYYSTTGEVLIFDGFLKVYSPLNKEKEAVFLPQVKAKQKVDLKQIDAIEKFTKHPPRYTEASLVRKLEELGIGRPSTYAPTISTIQNRGYVLKENREGQKRKYIHLIYISTLKKHNKTETFGTEKSKMFPTDIAMVVTDFLSENFKNIMDFNFTANVEKEFDDIADGKLLWYNMIDKFYKDFHFKIESTIKNAERNTGERILGVDSETGKQVSVRIGRFGAIVQLGVKEDKEKPKYSSITKEYHIETITLDEALGILNSSNNGRVLGQDPKTKKNVYARFARYGAVIQIGETGDKEKPKFASLLKGMTIDSITLDEALELFKLPRDVGMYESKKVVAAVGRFGPYVRHDSKFISLKKEDNPLTVTVERAIELIEQKREKDRKNLIKEFQEEKKLKIIKDRWGRACIHYNRKYYNIKDIKNPKDLSLKQCLGIVEKMQDNNKKKK
jgi:DNA topoisomerase-1